MNEQIEQNLEQQVKEKLFTLKDVNGNEQFEMVEKVGRLGDFLRAKDSNVKGVAVVGSTVKGYAMPESSGTSDVDISLIYDDPDAVEKNTGSWVSYRAEYDWIPEFSRENALNVQMIGEVNLSALDDNAVFQTPAFRIKDLIFPFFGNIEEHKHAIQLIRKKILLLSDEQKNTWANNFARAVVSYESTTKVLQRTGVKPYELIESRFELYRDRIKELFID